MSGHLDTPFDNLGNGYGEIPRRYGSGDEIPMTIEGAPSSYLARVDARPFAAEPVTAKGTTASRSEALPNVGSFFHRNCECPNCRKEEDGPGQPVEFDGPS